MAHISIHSYLALRQDDMAQDHGGGVAAHLMHLGNTEMVERKRERDTER